MSHINDKYILITVAYNESDEERIREYKKCVEKNQSNPLIERIVIFYDRSKDDVECTLKDYFIIRGLELVYIDSRPTFEQVFRFVNANFKGKRIIIANLDIYFDDSLGLLNGLEMKDTFIALTRWNEVDDELKFFEQKKWVVKNGNGRFVDWTGLSQDAWIFTTPLKIDFKCDFKIGTYFCDSFLNFGLLRSGLYVYNPSYDIKACHIHRSGVKSFDDQGLISRKAKTLFKNNMDGLNVDGIPPIDYQDCKKLRENNKKINEGNNNPLRGAISKGVSVFCAVKDRQENLEVAIKNWLSFSEVNQIVIVDWDSSQHLNSLIYKLDDERVELFVVKDQPRWILTKAFNLAASMTTRDKILKLDADIVLGDNFFKNNRLEKGEFICGNWKSAKSMEDRHLGGMFFVYREDFFSVRGFNERITSYGWDDDDLYIRLQRSGISRKTFSEGAAVHLPHSDRLRIKYQREVVSPLKQISDNLKYYSGIDFVDVENKSQFLIENVNFQERIVNLREKNRAFMPKVSIITSIYKADDLLIPFFENITAQTVFNKCELILVAVRPTQIEEKIINTYSERFSNIRYIKLSDDPGLYAVWNLAIKLSDGEYITNANIDDRRSPFHIERLIKELDENKYIDVVSSAIYASEDMLNEWDEKRYKEIWFMDDSFPRDYSIKALYKNDGKGGFVSQNIAHCMPVWRRSIHSKFGFFDEDEFVPFSDWEFWLRCASRGTVFRLVKEPLGVYRIDMNSYGRRFPQKEEKINQNIALKFGFKSKSEFDSN